MKKEMIKKVITEITGVSPIVEATLDGEYLVQLNTWIVNFSDLKKIDDSITIVGVVAADSKIEITVKY